MKFSLFLLDLDDTLLDFKASERLSFLNTLQQLGFEGRMDDIFLTYQDINLALWRRYEAGTVSQDFLKVERFRATFAAHGLGLNPEQAGRLYLDSLPETVVLIDGAKDLCAALSAIGEVGIVTNGVEHIQRRRIASSGLGGDISFIATSEAVGHAKPDVRFFQHAAALARAFSTERTVMIGDRLEADILGANRFGIASCWFNPGRLPNTSTAIPTYDVATLAAILPALEGHAAT